MRRSSTAGTSAWPAAPPKGRAVSSKLVLTVVAVVLACFLVWSSAGDAQHDKMVDELVRGGLDQWQGSELKIHGWIEAGTLVEAVIDQQTQRSFLLHEGGKKIRVFSAGPKPDELQERSEVVVTGTLVPAVQRQRLADALCAAKPGAGCPIRVSADQAWVVAAADLLAKSPVNEGQHP